jgi:exopolysaccharide production protein ExoQ
LPLTLRLLMERTVALLVCFTLIYVLLRIERKQAAQVSRAAWIPALWMLYHASKPISCWLIPYGIISISGDEIETGCAVDRNVLLLLMICGFTTIWRRGLDRSQALQRNRWLLVLMAYLLLSCLWSPVPMGSLKQWFRVLGCFIMALVVLTEADPDEALESILVRMVYILIPLSVVLVKWVPELGVGFGRWAGERIWEGACVQKNGLGRFCLVSAVVLVWRFVRRWNGRSPAVSQFQTPLEIVVLLMVLYLLKGPGAGGYSATAIGTLVLCLGLLLGLMLPRRSLAAKTYGMVAVFIIALAVVLACVSITGVIPSLGKGVFGRDSTFTGRTGIWEELRTHAWQNPILGMGYHGFWGQRHPDSPLLSLINEGHNGYLDVFLATGFVGLALLFLVIASYVWKASRECTGHFDWAVFKLVFLLMVIIHNFTESSFLRSSAHLWVLFIFLFAHSSGNRGKEGSTREDATRWQGVQVEGVGLVETSDPLLVVPLR